jgi:hypothetical protein
MNKTEIWDRLAKTDPAHAKEFKRGGGFKGTAVKPIYTERKMTETFGPCGTGWGNTQPTYEIIHGDNKEVLVYCTVGLWYARDDGTKSEVFYGVGGDKAVTYIKANPQKGWPERWENDDEAFKKAFTDAMGNAMKHLGMSADVHMGLFDDSKYVSGLKAEFAEPQDDRSPKQICDDFLDLVREITDRDEYVETWNSNKTVLKRIQRNAPEVYNQFIAELHKVIGPKGFNEAGSSQDAPKTGGQREDSASGGDSPARNKAREFYAAWKAAPHLTALETSMKQAGWLSTGEDGWIVRAGSHLEAIRDGDREAFDALAANVGKLQAKLRKEAA